MNPWTGLTPPLHKPLDRELKLTPSRTRANIPLSLINKSGMSSFDDSDFELDDVEEGTSVAQVSVMPSDDSAFVPPVVVKAASSDEGLEDMDDFENESEEGEQEQDEASPTTYKSPGKGGRTSSLKASSSALISTATPKRIPVLNRGTVNPYTYDTDYLLGNQDRVFLQSRARPETARSAKDYIKRNIASTKVRVQPIKPPSPDYTSKAALLLSPRSDQHRQVNVQSRLCDKAAKTEEKTAKLKLELEQAQLSHCTFRPEIMSKKQPRTFEDFFSEISTKDQLRQERVKRLQEEREMGQDRLDDFSYRPTLCGKSVKMQKDSSEPVYIKLYNQAKSHVQRRIDASLGRIETDSVVSASSDASSFKPFTPHLNKKSQGLAREGRIDDLLYADALRRTEHHKASVSSQSKPMKEKLISSVSDSLLRGKFLAEFTEHFEALETEGRLNYTQYRELMTRMRFVSAEAKDSRLEQERNLLLELWKEVVVGQQAAEKDRLEGYLLSLMGFYQGKGESTGIEGRSVGEVHLKYFTLYESRALAKKPAALPESFSFKPKIDTNSEKINHKRKADSQPAIGRHEDHLIKERDERLKRIESLRKAAENEELVGCTFKPKTNQKASARIGTVEHRRETLAKEYIDMMKSTETRYHTDLLYSLARKVNDKLTSKTQEAAVKRAEELDKGCTFKPDVSQSAALLHVRQRVLGEIPGTEEIIHRIKKGRAEHEWHKTMKERGATLSSSVSASSLNVGAVYKSKRKESFDALLTALPKTSSQTSYLESQNRHRNRPKIIQGEKQAEELKKTISGTKPKTAESSQISSKNRTSEVSQIGSKPQAELFPDPRQPHLSVVDPSQYSRDSSYTHYAEEPLLTITVNLSPTLTDQLVVNSFAEIDRVVDSFAIKHCKV
jgi:hypothetical protein